MMMSAIHLPEFFLSGLDYLSHAFVHIRYLNPIHFISLGLIEDAHDSELCCCQLS